MKKSLKEAHRKLNIFRYLSYKEYLQDLLSELRKIEEGCSIQTFSKHLGLGDNDTGRLVLSGQRRLTRRSALGIVTSLGLTGLERKYFWSLFQFGNETDATRHEQRYQRLVELQMRCLADPAQQKDLAFFSEWHHAVVFELIGAGPAFTSAEEIQKCIRFPLTVADVRRSLELLQDLNVVRWSDTDRCYIKLRGDFSSGQEVLGMGIINFHRKMMELARVSLENSPPDEREFAGLTFTVSESAEQKMRERIRHFQDELAAIASADLPAKAVVQLNVQLFRLSTDLSARYAEKPAPKPQSLRNRGVRSKPAKA